MGPALSRKVTFVAGLKLTWINDARCLRSDQGPLRLAGRGTFSWFSRDHEVDVDQHAHAAEAHAYKSVSEVSMRRVLAAATLMTIAVAAPARSAVIWHATFTPDPSGQTSEGLYLDFPMSAPATQVTLTVQGGTIEDIGWSSNPYYAIYDWYELPPNSGKFFLKEDTLPGGVGNGVETIHTTTTYSTFRYDTNNFDVCYGPGFHGEGVCGSVFQYGLAQLSGVTVDGDGPFELTLSDGVPEPSAWVMLLAGFALLGMSARRSIGYQRLARVS